MALRGEILFGLIMLAIFVIMTAMAVGYPAQARMLPLLVGSTGTILCVIQLARDIAARAPAAPESPFGREAALVAWLVAFIIGVTALGVVVGGGLMMFAFLHAYERESLKLSAVLTVSMAALLLLLFRGLLEVPLYSGLLWTALVG